jgi:hypothetical protein
MCSRPVLSRVCGLGALAVLMTASTFAQAQERGLRPPTRERGSVKARTFFNPFDVFGTSRLEVSPFGIVEVRDRVRPDARPQIERPAQGDQGNWESPIGEEPAEFVDSAVDTIEVSAVTTRPAYRPSVRSPFRPPPRPPF